MYTEMSGSELVAACRDDAAKWAAAFCEIISDGRAIDEGFMLGWFANAIETSYDVRTGRGVAVLPDGSAFFTVEVGSEPFSGCASGVRYTATVGATRS